MIEWCKDMSAAPKDGTKVLAAWAKSEGLVIVKWNGGNRYQSWTTGSVDRFGTPDQYADSWFAAWMPLPAYPT